MRPFRRWTAEIQDRIRYSALFQKTLGYFRLLAAKLGHDRARKLGKTALAHRALVPVTEARPTHRYLSSALSTEGNPWLERRIGWDRYRQPTENGVPAISHGLILKPKIEGGEKGVLVIWVEYNLVSLLRSLEIGRILDDYQVVFSTSWSPPDFSLLWAMSQHPSAEFWVIPSNGRDQGWIQSLPNAAKVLPFFASSFISGDDYAEAVTPDRVHDFCIVANWAPFKRHWTLFKALRQMPADLRIALIGQPEGTHTLSKVQQLAESYGVRQRIDWYDRLEPESVRRIQGGSHCGLMLSLREGSCLAVVESLLANVPAGMFGNAHVGSRDFINEETGRLLHSSSLPSDLMKLLELSRGGQFQPRRWALSHAEASVSSVRLEKILAEHSHQQGSAWEHGILPFCLRRARPDYLNREDWKIGMPWHEEFEQRYQVRFLWPQRNE